MVEPNEIQHHNPGVSARVNHAYYKYGRFVASHPVATIICSICSVIFLSYPLTQLRLPSSAPFDTVLADNVSEFLTLHERDPLWLKHDAKPPAAFVQQIFVRGKVQPWEPGNLTVKDAIKGPMDTAFELQNDLVHFVTRDNLGLENFCFKIYEPDPGLKAKFLPDHHCLILSPAQFWHNNRDAFYKDDYIFETIFGLTPCTNDLCIRDLLFGMPTRLTGVRRQYHTNRQRQLQFATTIVFIKYDVSFINQLRSRILAKFSNTNEEDALPALSSSSSSFVNVDDNLPEFNKFVHIYYKPQKAWYDYIPLCMSYICVFVYLYFSLRKIEMVKSKWGLAFSAVFTVASSLVMASGICLFFDLTPRLWSGELFPYLAMIVGIENMLCITRSVVSTPVSLDVRHRIAHGLSGEGWSITKNFLTELLVVTVGFLTRVPEIQEFCTLAFIGLVVDFYMQLFFYAPCLTFDLFRIDPIDKQRQLSSLTHFPKMPTQFYPPVRCPFSRFFSHCSDDERAQQMKKVDRHNSISGLLTGSGGNPIARDGSSSAKPVVTVGQQLQIRNPKQSSLPCLESLQNVGSSRLTTTIPRRLKFLLFLSKTRFFQRLVIIMVVGWICWLGVVVNQWQNISALGNLIVGNSAPIVVTDGGDKNAKSAQFPDYANSQDILPPNVIDSSSADQASKEAKSSPLKETSWIQWDMWQRKAFSSYPILFDIYNVSLSGRFISLLPPIFLDVNVTPDKAKSVRASDEPTSGPDAVRHGKTSELRLRISWLELQMFIVLILSCGIFLTVGAFIIYVCFISSNESLITYGSSVYGDALTPKKTHRRVGSKAIVESVPIVFRGHDQDVEFMCSATRDHLVSAGLGGRLLIWDAKTGDLIRSAHRTLLATVPPSRQGATTTTSATNVGDVTPQPSLRRRVMEALTIDQQTVYENGRSRGDQQQTSGGAGYAFNRMIPNRQSQTVGANSSTVLDYSQTTNQNFSSIWSLAAQGDMIAVGLANGTVELYSASNGLMRSQYRNGTVGVTEICLKGSRIVVARLNGQLDFFEFRLIASCQGQQQHGGVTQPTARPFGGHHVVESAFPDGHLQCVLIRTLTAHQHAVNRLRTSTRQVITASDDHTLKVFDLHTCECNFVLHGHNAPVTDVAVDDHLQCVYSTCSDGLICVWDLVEGILMRSLVEVSYANAPPVSLALTSTMLVGHTHDGSIWLWDKLKGELVTRIKPDTSWGSSPHVDTSSLAVLSDCLAVTGYRNTIRFWDLQYKIMLREVKLEASGSGVKHFVRLDDLSVACCKGNCLFRINFPVIKLK